MRGIGISVILLKVSESIYQLPTMKKTGIILLLALFLASCQPYSKDKDGITVYPKSTESKSVKAVRADILTDDIIHVRILPSKKADPVKSLVVDPSAVFPEVKWSLEDTKDDLVMKTASVAVHISKKTGRVSFYDLEGKKKLGEVTDRQSRYFTPKKIEGKEYYEVRQVFDSPDDEAFYGLGAHQNGQVNYKGEDVELMQHNIVDVVPFLVSNKNYGILWDNYSITKFGDPRNYMPLTVLKVYNESGEAGGLTATYYTAKDKKGVFISRT